LLQSGMAGFSGGQHGMSSAISVICLADNVPAATGAASGAVTMPTIARIGSNMRRVRQSFTLSLSHISQPLAKVDVFTRLPAANLETSLL
jgi:hypothetical protein